jgi:hypothetical protein
VSAEGSISGGLSKLLKAQGTLAASGGASRDFEISSAIKEIETKTLHDAAFDIAYMQLSSIIGVGNATDIGSYVELARPFQFIDFSYFERLFSTGGFIDFLKKTGQAEIERETQIKIEEALSEDKTRSKDDKRKTELALKQETKKIIAQNDKEYDDIADVVQAIKMLIPCEKMLISQDGYLIPLEEPYFRDNPRTMGFKYGGNITCFGYITNILQKTDAEDANAFLTVQNSINEFLLGLLPNRDGKLVVIHPIAIYYGSEDAKA